MMLETHSDDHSLNGGLPQGLTTARSEPNDLAAPADSLPEDASEQSRVERGGVNPDDPNATVTDVSTVVESNAEPKC